jgi:hypothetical protein
MGRMESLRCRQVQSCQEETGSITLTASVIRCQSQRRMADESCIARVLEENSSRWPLVTLDLFSGRRLAMVNRGQMHYFRATMCLLAAQVCSCHKGDSSVADEHRVPKSHLFVVVGDR